MSTDLREPTHARQRGLMAILLTCAVGLAVAGCRPPAARTRYTARAVMVLTPVLTSKGFSNESVAVVARLAESPKVLATAARDLQASGTKITLQRIEHDITVTPDEATCRLVIEATTSRSGLSKRMVEAVCRTLQLTYNGIRIREFASEREALEVQLAAFGSERSPERTAVERRLPEARKAEDEVVRDPPLCVLEPAHIIGNR